MAPQLKNMTMHTPLIDHESITTVDQSSNNDKSYKPLTENSDDSKCETDSPEKSTENVDQSSHAESDDIESTGDRSNNGPKNLRWASRIKVRPIKHVKSMSKREIKRIGDEPGVHNK